MGRQVEHDTSGGAGSRPPTPHLTSPLKADLRTTPNFAGWRQPDQIGTIGLHRWIRGLCEGLLKGGRDELGKGRGLRRVVPACAGMTEERGAGVMSKRDGGMNWG